MMSVLDRAAALAAYVSDTATAAASAAWPRSAAAQEIARLAENGYTVGSTCEVAFSLSFPEPSAASAAVGDIRGAGFTVGENARGFVTVRSALPLRAWHLARATAQLGRVATRHGGFATIIGPVDSALPSARAQERERVTLRQHVAA